MMPWPSRPFLGHVVKKNRADLYGPFWICATLVVAIAVSGNLAAYRQSPQTIGLRWHYDFHKVRSPLSRQRYSKGALGSLNFK